MKSENISNLIEGNLQEFNDLVDGLFAENIVSSFRHLHNVIHDPSYDESIKEKCLGKAVNKVAHYNTNECAVEFLFCLSYEFHSDAQKDDNYSRSITSLVKQIMNHPVVIESYRNSRVRYKNHYYAIKPICTINLFFKDKTVIQILRNSPSRKLFIIFGYHPAVANHVDLQVKWIRYYCQYKKITPILVNQNLTEKALLSIPIADAVDFISKVISESYEEFHKYMKLFNTETIRRIVCMYTVAYGKDEKAEEILRALSYIEKLS